MKRFAALMLVLLFGICLSAAAFADGEYADMYTLWNEAWCMPGGMPDWVAGVSSTDGSAENLTVTLKRGCEDREAELRAMLADDSTLTVAFGAAWSDAELTAIADEIVKEFMTDGTGVTGCGVGWTSIDGKVTGFGESGTESRVCVMTEPGMEAELTALFARRYGDAVYVEGSGYDLAEAALDTTAALPSQNGPVWFGCGVSALLLAAAAIVFSRRERRH